MDQNKRLKLAAQVHPAFALLCWQLLANLIAGHIPANCPAVVQKSSVGPGLGSFLTGLLHALQIAKDVVNRGTA